MLTGISQYHCEQSEEDGVLRVELEAEPETDVREAVFFRMAEAGLPILEMKTTNMSLEDVFLELTEGEAVSDPEADSEVDFEADSEADPEADSGADPGAESADQEEGEE